MNAHRVQEALNALETGILIVDKDNIIRSANSMASKIVGYATHELLNRMLEEVYQTTPDTSTEAFTHYIGKSSYQETKSTVFGYKILNTKNGTTIPIEEKVTELFDTEKVYDGRLIQFSDLRSSREADLKSYSYRVSYLKVLEELPFLIFRVNTDQHFNYFNSQWLEFTGRTMDEEIYRGWLSRTHPEDREKFERAFEKALQQQTVMETEFRLKNHDGIYRWLCCILNPFTGPTGQFAGYIGFCVDITDRKFLEAELRHAKKLADSASEAKTNFISNMSHEIRTPLNTIMGLTDVLLDMDPDSDQIKYLALVKEASQTLLRFLNNLLAYSEIELKEEPIEEVAFSVSELIEEVSGQLQPQAHRNGSSLDFSIAPEVPDVLYGDQAKLGTILANLLSNAIKFSVGGDVKILASREYDHEVVDERFERTFIRFRVSDTGIGIAEKQRAKIFDSFTQVDESRTRTFSGVGLGLAIVKRFTDQMGGQVWVESELGKGSCFQIILGFKQCSKKVSELT